MNSLFLSSLTRSALVGPIFLPLAPVLPATAAAQGHGDGKLGAVHFQVSCAPEVQADFDRAVGLLHHMMYAESRTAFEEIAARDSKCAMAQWGIAMTYFQPLWPARPGPEAIRSGSEAARTAKELGAATERERDFIAAVEAFYSDPGGAGYWARIQRWEEAMGNAHRARPDDVETAAFFALAHLARGLVAEDRMAYQARAAEILLGIYEREPTHPGAIHYTIHANDVDGRAGESLDVVRSYGGIAPSVPHALHMPTHIFVRLGDWPEVIEWNVKSSAAALRFSEGAISMCAHYPHSQAYLLYAYLQRGEDKAAAAVLEETQKRMRGEKRLQQEFVCAFHLAAMPARHAVERRAWAEASSLPPRSPAHLAWDEYPWPEAITWFARGLGAARAGDLSAARLAEARMGELRDRAEGMGEQNWARYIEIDRRVLAGWLAHGEGDTEDALALMRSAAELERTVQKDPVTPAALVPPYEALGDLLLELRRPAEALEAYESSLRIWPRRFNTLLGAARAARDAGNPERAHVHYEELMDVAGGSATTRDGVREARRSLAGQGSS
jgi:tetratricopeptide (TPR) repeat protein